MFYVVIWCFSRFFIASSAPRPTVRYLYTSLVRWCSEPLARTAAVDDSSAVAAAILPSPDVHMHSHYIIWVHLQCIPTRKIIIMIFYLPYQQRERERKRVRAVTVMKWQRAVSPRPPRGLFLSRTKTAR